MPPGWKAGVVPRDAINEDDELPADLYHYTTAGGLHGILESNSLYATHAAYLNDSQELLYGMQLALDELTAWVKKLPDEAKDGWGTTIQNWVIPLAIKATAVVLRGEISKRTQSLRQVFGPFVTCLSESRDQLGQWRGYGRGGGYAIRFDAQALRESIQHNRVGMVDLLANDAAKHGVPLGAARFMKMDYKPESQIPLLREHLTTFITAYAARIGTNKQTPEQLAQHRSELVEPLLNQVLAMAMRMKDSGFKEEKEYRIATFSVAELFSPGETGLVPRSEALIRPVLRKRDSHRSRITHGDQRSFREPFRV